MAILGTPNLILYAGSIIRGTYKMVGDLVRPVDSVELQFPKSLRKYTHGSAINQANRLWADERTATAAPDNINLTTDLHDEFGNALVFTKVRELHIHHKTETEGQVLALSGDALTDLFSGSVGTLKILPGAVFVLSSPIDNWTITAPTKDVLTFNPGTATITYRVAIVGVV